MAGFDDQLIDGPTLVVHQEITDMTENAIGGLKVVAAHGLGAAEMLIGVVGFQAARNRWRAG